MKGIVLASHGPLADGLLESSKMFMGQQEQLLACCLMPENGPEEYERVLTAAIKDVDSGDGVYVLCDIPFGTPFNCMSRIDAKRVEVITGMNLAMLLQILAVREASDSPIAEILNAGINSISTMNKLIQSEEIENDLF